MDNGRRFYTYAYLREDGTPYYIGKGEGKRAYKNSCRKGCLRPTDRSRILILKKNLTEGEAFRHEIYMIAVLGRKDKGTGILRNLTDGGDGATGYKHSDEAREKIRRAKLGKPRSPETRAKIGAGNKNKFVSQETREKLSRAFTGVSRPERWKCLVTGMVSSAGGLTTYQKNRNIDTGMRKKVQ